MCIIQMTQTMLNHILLNHLQLMEEQKVAILGLTTKNVPGWENPSNYAGLKFNDLVDEAKIGCQ